ncbi:MAG: ATP-binding protein [Coriobacteriales bacterium]|nr:ATP-binding protein [Coriobacteriales bacterium]
MKEWDTATQTPQYIASGNAWYMIRNPLYHPNKRKRVVEHLLVAARGGANEDEASAFVGRIPQLNTVIGWIRNRRPGLYVVTGPPGSGKSALVGRVVSIADPVERARLTAEIDAGVAARWPHDDPGEGSVAAQVHARGMTADQLAEIIDDELTAEGGVLTKSPSGRSRNAASLVGELQDAANATAWQPPTIVVDGLDEAREQVESIAEQLLARLAPVATVIVATRDVAFHSTRTSLIERLAPHGPDLDLGAAEVQAASVEDVRTYISQRLRGVSPRMAPNLVADHFVARESRFIDRSFLLARIVTDQLRARPVDTAASDWHEHVASTYVDAFKLDLRNVAVPTHRTLPSGIAASRLANDLLATLTFGYGAGFPLDEWHTVASAVLPEAHVVGEDLVWVLDQAGRFVVQDGEDDQAVYRVAHQSLADILRPRHALLADGLLESAAEPISESLGARYLDLLAAGWVATAPRYLWRYMWRHAADSGPKGLDTMRRLARHSPPLIPDVAASAEQIALTHADRGDRATALPYIEEAVGIYRVASRDNVVLLPRLARALSNMSTILSDLDRSADSLPPLEEAVTMMRELAAENQAFQPVLAWMLNDLGVCLSHLGRPGDALPPAEEASEMFRSLAATNPLYVPDFALSLSNLGVRYAELGRDAEALAPTEQAVELLREASADSPAHLSEYTTALMSLGNCLGTLGHAIEAVPPTEEALGILEQLAVVDPRHLADLASAHNTLGVRYADVGRTADALAQVLTAVSLHRSLVHDPTNRPGLAAALSNSGNYFADLDRPDEAIDAALEALDLYRELAFTNTLHLSGLSLVLNNLGAKYRSLGRADMAIKSAQEAVSIRRRLAAENVAYLPDLASSLNNLGIDCGTLGLHEDAKVLFEEAVDIRRGLVASNPAYFDDLANELSNLTLALTNLGRPGDALPFGDEAISLAKESKSHSSIPCLGRALVNQAAAYTALGRRTEALRSTEEAVVVYRDLASSNSAYAASLARALKFLGRRYWHLELKEQAVAASSESISRFRDLEERSPTHSPGLAEALGDLAGYLAELGHFGRAAACREESIRLYASVAVDRADVLGDLARGLVSLSALRSGGAFGEATEDAWSDTLLSLPAQARSQLLLLRCTLSEPTPQAATWIVRAMRELDEDSPVHRDLRTEARRHRAEDVDAFDAVWTDATRGGRLPDWLLVDPETISVALGWLETESFADEYAYLTEHPELLDARFDQGLGEALCLVDDPNRYRQIRADARIDGIEAAYWPLLTAGLAAEFTYADVARKRELLRTRLDDLLDTDVQDALTELQWDEDLGPAASQARAILRLAASNHGAEALAVVAGDVAPLHTLQSVAITENAVQLLAPYSELVWLLAESTGDEEVAAVAGLYLSVAAVISGDQEGALYQLDEAQGQALSAATRDTWIQLLVEITRQHPQALELLRHLVAGPPSPSI